MNVTRHGSLLVAVCLMTCAPPTQPPPPQLPLIEILRRDHCTGTPTVTVDPETIRDRFFEGESRRVSFVVKGVLTCDSGQRPLDLFTATSDRPELPLRLTVRSVDAQTRRLNLDFVVPPVRQLTVGFVLEPDAHTHQTQLEVVPLSPRTWRQRSSPGCVGLLEAPFGTFCVGHEQVSVPLAGGDTPMRALAAAVTSTQLWLFDGATVRAYSFDAGVGQQRVERPSARPLAVNTSGPRVVWVANDELVAMDEPGVEVGRTRLSPPGKTFGGMQFFLDGGVMLYRGSGWDLVPLPTSPDETFTLVPYVDEPDTTVTTNKEGVWIRTFDPFEKVHKLTLRSPDNFGVRFAVPSVPLLEPPLLTADSSPVLPLTTTLLTFPVPLGGFGIAHEFVELPAGTTASWATTSSLFAVGDGGQLWWTERRAP